MSIPDHLRYTPDHEWILMSEDGIATIGITSYAQRELGDIVYVDIDSKSRALSAREAFGTIEAVKTVSDLYAPISGTLEEVNSQLEDVPEMVNADPYGEGWMIKIRAENMDELEDLMDAAQYHEYIKEKT